MKAIYVAEQFSETLGGRYIKEGDYSGEEFYLKLLYPTFCKAIFNREKILIDLTGCLGFPTSFLDESFGRLAREHEGFKLNNIITLRCKDYPAICKVICDDFLSQNIK